MENSIPVCHTDSAASAGSVEVRLERRHAGSNCQTGSLATHRALRPFVADDGANQDQRGHAFRGALSPELSLHQLDGSVENTNPGNVPSPGFHPYSDSDRAWILDGADRIQASKVKLFIDIQISLLLVLLLLPLLLLVAAFVKVSSPGPVLYKQTRYGRGKRHFNIYKFRTMRVLESGSNFCQVTRPDHRVTAVGAILRRMSLDELPQLFNVLQGAMSLVGPRPHPVGLDDQYLFLIKNYEDRFLVKPGITGLAQTRGFRGPTYTIADMSARIESDREYIARWSLFLDAKIFLQSFRVFSDPNAF